MLIKARCVAGIALMTIVSAIGSAEAGEADVKIIGHRGASHDAPENTLAAIRLAWEQSADAVECDVYLSADGKVVLHHDKDTRRTAGVERRIDAHTFEQLQQLDVGSWKDRRFEGERIPLLADVLLTVPDGKRLYIEIKCGPEIVPELKRVLAASKRPTAQTVLISFSREVCTACVDSFPGREVYWIVALKKDEATQRWNHTAAELITEASRLRVTGLDLQAVDLIDRAFGEAVRAAKLKLLVWTVNDVALARRMKSAGVVGITTDRPGWLREQLSTP